jgi:hypothetical protein
MVGLQPGTTHFGTNVHGRFLRPRTKGLDMGIGLGIVLLLAGIILVSDVVNFDMEFVDDNGLGWILIVVGALAIVLALIINQQRSTSTRVERHIEE